MALIIAITSCTGTSPGTTTGVSTTTQKTEAPGTTQATSTSDKPQYGGTINLLSETLLNDKWRLFDIGQGNPHQLAFNRLWDGDWAKGPAGGYGTNQVNWEEMTNVPELKTGYLAESWRIDVDNTKGGVKTSFQIRKDVYFAQTGSEAGKLVNGRELTADDVVWNLDQLNNNPIALNYQYFPQMHGIKAEKTGPWEVSITYPSDLYLSAMLNTIDCSVIIAPELYEKYGTDFNNWDSAVGTGPYMITDCVLYSVTTLVKNPNYWMTNPVGPGKGDQLPYIQTVKLLTIPDRSTELAALRTGAIDQLSGLDQEENMMILRQKSELKSAARGSAYIWPAYMRVDKAPFDSVKVRQAMMMAINIEEINKSQYADLGTYPSWPYYKTPAYADLYMSLDDAECPDSVKELFIYNPDKAKELLKEAGYADGFDTELTLLADYVDYYSIIKEYLAKIKVKMTFKILPDMGQMMSVAASGSYQMIASGCPPVATFPQPIEYAAGSPSMLNDTYINETATKASTTAITDMKAAMAITREMMPYLQNLAICIQNPRYPTYTIWWPWVKNYTGETTVGYFTGPTWVQFTWVDQSLKKSMGH
jgi:peptide/nickel transport system substrate-binding protein